MIDLEPIKARVDAVGDEPMTYDLQSGYWAIAIRRHKTWNNDVLASCVIDSKAYAALFTCARDDIRTLIAEIERLRKP